MIKAAAIAAMLAVASPACFADCEVNAQLAEAHAATVAARARLERIQHIMKLDIADPSVADVLHHSETLTRLRNQYLDLAADLAARERILDATNDLVLRHDNLRTLMEEIRHDINDEMEKIETWAKDDYETAVAREKCALPPSHRRLAGWPRRPGRYGDSGGTGGAVLY
jgi:hypothetical protein